MNAPFVHLRAHSEKSMVDSVLRVEDLVSHAKAHKMGAVALTDLSNLFGAIGFQSQARAAGVKPIFGADLWVEAHDPLSETDNKPSRLLLLCESEAGYKNLMTIISRAYTDNNQGGQAIVRREWLVELNAGLLCLTGDEINGELGQKIVAGDLDGAREAAKRLAELFPGRVFVELQRRGGEKEGAFVLGAARIASELGLPPVATHPAQFLKREDFLAHEVRVCDATSEILHDPGRPREFTNEQYLKSPQEMAELFSDLPQALANAGAIAARCNVKIQTGKSYLPDFPTPNGEPIKEFFPIAAREGLERRLVELFPNEAERDAKRPEYLDRLKFEVDIIAKMGFEGYFLIVSDFIRWGKEHDVPIGPGRGSGAGSLVAYSLNITDLDPLRFSLLFERFLNPERVSMPDFDVDFCSEKRELVIDYVRNKYGHEAVSQISTFGSFAAKAAVKAVGRVLDVNFVITDAATKLMVSKPGDSPSIDDFVEREPKLRDLLLNDAKVRRVFDLARQIEGLTANIGKHAGGVLIAPGRVSDFSPLYVPKDSNAPVSQFDKDDIEKAGLVKFDFLAVSTLTHLDKAVKLIRKLPGEEGFDLAKLDMDQKDVFSIFNEGNTYGIFQMEQSGITQVGKDIVIESIDHLTDLLALYRPGPLESGMVTNYIERKNGREQIASVHPLIDDLLEPTYGVIVYQEQVMQVAQKLANYSLGGADLLRRAMGKKKPEEMAKQLGTFVKGAAENGVPEKQAEDLFRLIEKFAEYGFNKSHSAAYAYLSYQTAYVKKRFPAQFFAAGLTCSQDDTDKVAASARDAKKNGLTILPPDIHLSRADFSIVEGHEDQIRFGFAGLKGVGPVPAEMLTRLRDERGPFESVQDFCVKLRAAGKEYTAISSKVIETLVKSGAFDSLAPNRKHTIENLKSWLAYGKALQERAEKLGAAPAQGALAGLDPILAKSAEAAAEAGIAPAPAEGEAPTLEGIEAPKKKKKAPAKPRALKPINPPEVTSESPEDPIVRLHQEKEALGFFMSQHPFELYKRELGGLGWAKPLGEASQMPPSNNWETVAVAGLVLEVKPFNSDRGKFARVRIDDGTGELSVMVFSEAYAETSKWLKGDQFVTMDVSVRPDRRNPDVASFSANSVLSFDDMKQRLADRLNLRVLPEQAKMAIELLAKHEQQNGLPVTLWHPTSESTYARVPLKIGVGLNDAVLEDLRRELGAGNVSVGYKRDFQMPQRERRQKPRYSR
jgi:DNA polymerase III subunit alpha